MNAEPVVGRSPRRAIARWEFRSSVRARWVLIMGAVFAVGCLAVTLLAFRTVRGLGVSGIGPASATLVNLGVLIPSLMGLILGAGSIVGAREQGMLGLLATQPIPRTAIATGTVVGLTASLWTTLAIGLGVTFVVMSGVARTGDLPALAALVGSILGVAAASVSIGVAVSSWSTTRAQAVAGAVAVWIVTSLGVDLALAALAPSLHLGPRGLLVTILLDPLEAGRILALLGTNLQGTALGPFGAYLVGTFGVGGTVAMLAADLIVWTLGPLQLARWALRRRDL
jgi:ABC-type transport system involved in multi-copper enzyme maturation permease subunit